MKFSTCKMAMGVASFLCVAAIASAQIERLTLAQMVSKTDGSVAGTIMSKSVETVPDPLGDGSLYFTVLTVQGTSLVDGTAQTLSVAYPGGDLVGVHNSEAPSADETKVGRSVVVFYKWSDNMGGGFASNALYASHGGLFRTFVTRKGDVVVQGRGMGYAVPTNRVLGGLETEMREHRATRRK